MKGIIWCTTMAEGNEMLERIIKNYTQYGRYTIRHKQISTISGSSRAEFSNGDYWQVCRASDNSRGARCNVAYIQRNISYDVYCTIISPCMFNFPFSAIHLWGEGDLHISDEPSLPF